MPISFKVPTAMKKSILLIDTFLGVDFTNSPANVSENRSPMSVNMVRSVPGKVRKSLGYQTVSTYDDQINGIHFPAVDESPVIHSGTNYYVDDVVLYSTGNDEKSYSFKLDKDNLYIADGKKLLVYNGTTIKTVEESAYIPTLTIGKSPSGGGTDYEPLNLIQPGFIELFLGTVSTVAYSLSFGGLDATEVIVRKLASEATWTTLVEDTDFTVNRTTGVVTFTTAPGVSPVTGVDNIEIKAFRTVTGYADRINKCDIGISFGVNGAQDRIFLSGNPDYPNQDWFSQQFDLTYYGDTNYSKIGSASSSIVCYSIINNRLVTHKKNDDQDQNVIIRSGDLIDNKAAFPIYNTLHGTGAISKHGIANLTTEPLFLTADGVFAITAQDITGEKYTQSRSFFLNGKLLKEANLEEAYACVHDNRYILAINGVLYMLDGLQSVQTDKSEPYSTRQYVGFYRTNVDARVISTIGNLLYFGSSDGKLCVFYTDVDSASSYNDDGVAIECTWETPDIDGQLFYKNKTIRSIAIKLQAAVATSIKIYAQKLGLWIFIKEDDTTARYFNFSQINFAKFSFSTDTSQKIVRTKVRVKKVDKTRFKFSNDALNEPFGLFDIAIEYVESGDYKGG